MVDFTYTEPVDSQLFVGRQTIVSELEAHVQSSVLIGDARIGKTSLLRYLKYRLSKLDDRSRRQIPIYLNLRSPTLTSQADVYRAIATTLLNDESVPRSFTKKKKPEMVGTATELLNVLEQLAVNSVQVTPVVLIDNIDQPLKFMSERLDLYTGLRQVLDFSSETTPLKIVASATPIYLVLEQPVVTKLRSRLRTEYLGALSDSDVAELAGRSTLFTESGSYDVILKYLIEQSGGHPCLLQELIVKTIQRRRPNELVLHRLELEAREIKESGGSFFQAYVRELSNEEFLHLLPIAFGAPSGEWHMPESSIKRFASAGLIRETPEGGVDPSCALFFRWFKHNVGSVLPSLSYSKKQVTSAEDFVDWLQEAVHTVVPGLSLRSEKDLSAVIQGILAGGAVGFEREVGTEFKTKQYRIDLVVPPLGIAIELKFVADATRLGQIIDQVEVDALAYKGVYRHFIAVIVTPGASSRLHDYARVARDPYIHFIVAECMR